MNAIAHTIGDRPANTRLQFFYQIRYGNFTSGAGDRIEKILKEISAKDLRRFVSNLLKRDRHFRRKFLREFDEEFEDDEDFEEDFY